MYFPERGFQNAETICFHVVPALGEPCSENVCFLNGKGVEPHDLHGIPLHFPRKTQGFQNAIPDLRNLNFLLGES